METYCLCRKKTKNIDPEISSTNKCKSMILPKCAICRGKKSRFVKNQKIQGLLSNLGIKTPFNKLTILSDILF